MYVADRFARDRTTTKETISATKFYGQKSPKIAPNYNQNVLQKKFGGQYCHYFEKKWTKPVPYKGVHILGDFSEKNYAQSVTLAIIAVAMRDLQDFGLDLLVKLCRR
jgi:hypothetical protein